MLIGCFRCCAFSLVVLLCVSLECKVNKIKNNNSFVVVFVSSFVMKNVRSQKDELNEEKRKQQQHVLHDVIPRANYDRIIRIFVRAARCSLLRAGCLLHR